MVDRYFSRCPWLGLGWGACIWFDLSSLCTTIWDLVSPDRLLGPRFGRTRREKWRRELPHYDRGSDESSGRLLLMWMKAERLRIVGAGHRCGFCVRWDAAWLIETECLQYFCGQSVEWYWILHGFHQAKRCSIVGCLQPLIKSRLLRLECWVKGRYSLTEKPPARTILPVLNIYLIAF